MCTPNESSGNYLIYFLYSKTNLAGDGKNFILQCYLWFHDHLKKQDQKLFPVLVIQTYRE